MSKVNGIPTSFTIDDSAGSPVTFSAQVGTCNLNASRAQQDVTGLDKDGTERIQLRGDFTVDFSGFWEPATVIPVFGDLSNERDLVLAFPGATATGKVIIGTFNTARGQDGSLGWTANASQSDGASQSTVWDTTP
jgi:hypothetical protein